MRRFNETFLSSSIDFISNSVVSRVFIWEVLVNKSFICLDSGVTHRPSKPWNYTLGLLKWSLPSSSVSRNNTTKVDIDFVRTDTAPLRKSNFLRSLFCLRKKYVKSEKIVKSNLWVKVVPCHDPWSPLCLKDGSSSWLESVPLFVYKW